MTTADDPSDGAVVRRVLAGEREAFRLLVRRYQELLYRHALRLTGTADVAADVTQASLVKAYTQLARCREPERFGGWVYRILVNGCKDHLKSRRRRDTSLEVVVERAAPGPDPAEQMDRAEIRRTVDAALARLPEVQREAFLLKHVEGMSYEEMEALLRVSVPALKMRVHRAREALRTIMEEAR
jgi:RNA polymerase sigma-70 factor, ECF subfamily